MAPISDSLSLWLSPTSAYNSPAHSSTGTRSDVESSSHCLSTDGFMFYFTPLTGVLFTFPSRYWFTIAHAVVFSLTRWSSLIHTGFLVPHATRDSAWVCSTFDYRSFTFSGAASHLLRLVFHFPLLLSHYPKKQVSWFRLFPVRSPLLGESFLLSFPLATKMFQFARLAHTGLYIQPAVY